MKKIFLSILMMLLAVNAFATDEWDKTRLAGTTLINNIDAETQAQNASLDRLLANYREGMTLTYSSGSTIVVSSGEVVCSNSGATIRKFRQNTSSTNVTFSDIDTGSEASGTSYYVFASCDADATTATFKISSSSTSPSGVTYYKKLGSFYNDSSSNITSIDNDNSTKEFTAWTSKSVDVTYQATTDGYVCATITGATCSYLTGYTDNSSSPTTIHGYATAVSNAQADHTVTASGFCMPVKAGDYYKVTASKNDGSCTSGTQTVYFLPIN